MVGVNCVYISVASLALVAPILAVKVHIDKNDNPPIFDRANYDVSVAQDTQRDTQIFRVSATDVDEGENGKIIYNLEATRFPADIEYFRWDDETGAVWLNKELDKFVPVGSVFVLKATAHDGGTPPKSSDIDVTIEVKASGLKPPVFINGPGANISLPEGMVDFSKPIASYSADSQIPGDPTVFFELLNGRTEQTNKAATFRATQDEDNQQQVNIYIAKPLEFEAVQQYTLTLQVRNIYDLVAEAQLNVKVKVKDKNNQGPGDDDIVAVYRNAFNQVDTDQDGKITKPHFWKVLVAVDSLITPEMVDILDMFAAMADTDEDNMLSADEINNLIATWGNVPRKAAIGALMLKLHDKDRNGKMSSDELNAMRPKYGDITNGYSRTRVNGAIDMALQKMDADGDGQLSLEEYVDPTYEGPSMTGL